MLPDRINVYIKVNGITRRILFRFAISSDVKGILNLSKTTDRFRISEETDKLDVDELLYWIDDPRSIVLVAEELLQPVMI